MYPHYGTPPLPTRNSSIRIRDQTGEREYNMNGPSSREEASHATASHRDDDFCALFPKGRMSKYAQNNNNNNGASVGRFFRRDLSSLSRIGPRMGERVKEDAFVARIPRFPSRLGIAFPRYSHCFQIRSESKSSWGEVGRPWMILILESYCTVLYKE